jgi:hypothetical protein
MANKCTCGAIILGVGKKQRTAGHNWNRDCLEHGVGSDWYEVDGGKEYHQKQIDESVALQRQAREARKKADDGS